MRYFILSTPGQTDEVARWQRHGGAFFYDHRTGTWVPDPLLATELSIGDEWQPIDKSVLPPELIADDSEPRRPTRRSGRRRRSRGSLFRRFR